MSQDSDLPEIPPQDTLNVQFSRIEQIGLRVRDLAAQSSVISPFRGPNYVKLEEERMQDVIPTSTRNPFMEPYHPSSNAGMYPMYQESIPPTDEYWTHASIEGGRSKYKKRSVWLVSHMYLIV